MAEIVSSLVIAITARNLAKQAISEVVTDMGGMINHFKDLRQASLEASAQADILGYAFGSMGMPDRAKELYDTRVEMSALAQAAGTAAGTAEEEAGAMGRFAAGLAANLPVIGAVAIAVVGLGLALKSVTEAAATFEYDMTIIRNNMNITDTEFQKMQVDVTSLGAATGASFNDIGNAIRVATNSGFAYEDAIKLANIATEMAVATGAKATDVTKALALAMHDYGIAGADANKTAEMLNIAFRDGNMTLEQGTQGMSKMTATAADLGVPLDALMATYAALTRETGSATQAGTALTNLMIHLADPTSAATKEIVSLGNALGINFQADLQNISSVEGYSKALADLAIIEKARPGDLLKIEGGIRGGIAAMALAGKGGQDYTSILRDLSGATNDATTITQNFAREQATLKGQVDDLKERVDGLKVSLGEHLVPALADVVTGINNFAKELDKAGGFIHDAEGKSEFLKKAIDSLGMAAVASLPGIGGLIEAVNGITDAANAAGAAAAWAKRMIDDLTGARAAQAQVNADYTSDLDKMHQASQQDMEDTTSQTNYVALHTRAIGDNSAAVQQNNQAREFTHAQSEQAINDLQKMHDAGSGNLMETAAVTDAVKYATSQLDSQGIALTKTKEATAAATQAWEKAKEANLDDATAFGLATNAAMAAGQATTGAGAAAKAAAADHQAMSDATHKTSSETQQLQLDIKTAEDILRSAYQPAIEAATKTLRDHEEALRADTAAVRTDEIALAQLKDGEQSYKNAVTAATDVVKHDELAIRDQQLAIRAQQDQIKAANAELTNYKKTLTDLTDGLTAATNAEKQFSAATLPGSQAFSDQATKIKDQMASIQLQMDQIVSTDMATGMTRSAAEANAALAPLQHQLDQLSVQMDIVNQQSTITLDPLKKQIADLQATGNTFDFGKLIEQLTNAQKGGQAGLQPLIDQLTALSGKSKDALTMKQITDGITAAQAAEVALNQAIPGANTAITQQQTVVDKLNTQLDQMQTKLQSQQDQLIKDQTALQAATEAQQAYSQKIAEAQKVLDEAIAKQKQEQTVVDQDKSAVQGLQDQWTTAADQIRNSTNPAVDLLKEKMILQRDAAQILSDQIRAGNIPSLQTIADTMNNATTPASDTLTTHSNKLLSPALQTATDKLQGVSDTANNNTSPAIGTTLVANIQAVKDPIDKATGAMDAFTAAMQHAAEQAAKGIDLTVRIHTVSGGGGGGGTPVPAAVALAGGGVVASPTFALIGEAGPEAVIPLSDLATGGPSIVININNPQVWQTSDINNLVDQIGRQLTQRMLPGAGYASHYR